MESTVTEQSSASVPLPLGRVLSFATITAAGFVLGKLTGIVREMVVGATFGLSAQMDAYVLAFVVPTVINNIVAGSGIALAAMPTLARYLTGDTSDRAPFWRAASMITNIILLVTGLLTVLGMLFARPIIGLLGGAFDPATQDLAASLLVLMMPTLLLGAALNMLMAMLNSLDRFAAPALVFLALNLGMIAVVVLLAPYIGIHAVAWGFLFGVFLQVVIQLFELRLERPQYSWRIDWHHPALKPVLLAFVPITLVSITAQINYAADKAMAAWLVEGSVSALNYADSILGAFYMVGISLSIAIFPNLNRLAAANDLENTASQIAASLRVLVFILAPLTLILIPFAAPAIGVLLGRGAFDVADVAMTSQALSMYALGLVGIAALYVVQRAFYALGDNMTPFVIGGLTAGVHILLNLVLMRVWGHAGIALSTSLTATTAVVLMLVLLARRIPGLGLGELFRFLAGCFLLAFVATFPIAWIAQYVQLDYETSTSRLAGISLALVAGLVYFILALGCRVPESRMLLSAVSNRAIVVLSRAKRLLHI